MLLHAQWVSANMTAAPSPLLESTLGGLRGLQKAAFQLLRKRSCINLKFCVFRFLKLVSGLGHDLILTQEHPEVVSRSIDNRIAKGCFMKPWQIIGYDSRNIHVQINLTHNVVQ